MSILRQLSYNVYCDSSLIMSILRQLSHNVYSSIETALIMSITRQLSHDVYRGSWQVFCGVVGRGKYIYIYFCGRELEDTRKFQFVDVDSLQVVANLPHVVFFFFFFSLISLIADGPHHYHPACGH